MNHWLEQWPEEVVRAKGFLWIATRNDVAITLSQAGPSIQIGASGYWIAALPEEEKQLALAETPDWVETWDSQYGDRINELVFIGIDMDKAKIIRSLDACLLSEVEIQADWSTFVDPLPTNETIIETLVSNESIH